MQHEVPPNKCDGRITIASNLYISEAEINYQLSTKLTQHPKLLYIE